MQFTPIWFVTLSIYLISVFIIGFLAKFAVKPLDSEKFSFKRVFPFEALKHNVKPSLYRGLLCVFVAVSFAPLFNLLTNYGEIANVNALSIIICCVFGLASICFAFLHYFDATHTLVHITLVVLFICFTLFGNTLAAIKGYAVYNVLSAHGHVIIVTLIGAVICSLCALACIILSINPKLKNWAALQKLENGYARPKVFILALTEWITFLLLVIGESAYFLVLLVH